MADGGGLRPAPWSAAARLEADFLLRRLQRGERLRMPHSRPMPSIGPRCHELRIVDGDQTWRVICRADAVVILAGLSKKAAQTPQAIVDACQRHLRSYDATR